jgi:HlyD family secretion protein
MPTPLFPSELAPLTIEGYLPIRSRTSHVIYVLVILALLGIFAALPFLFVDVSVKSSGQLKASVEVSTIKAVQPGFVQQVFIKENQMVKQGQLLFAVRSPVLEEKLNYLRKKLEETDTFLKDVNLLLTNDPQDLLPNTLSTSLYRQQLSDFHQKLVEKQTAFQKKKQDYDRNKKLYDQKVIASVEFEGYAFELEKAKNDLGLLNQAQLTSWQQELRNYRKEKTEYENQLAEAEREKDNLHIKAPISGTIQNLVGIYEGSPVFAGQELGQISPDAKLLAEIYVSPADIGLLRPDMEARMQVNAFNYNQWGLLKGKIKEISNDIQMLNNQPVFEVKCNLLADHLSLKNGYIGKLKKGMTVQARFIVVRRSLWQLLYDKVDDWLNPNIKAE